MEKVISSEKCSVRDHNGKRVDSTCQVYNTGIVINGQPVIGWNFVSEPGIVFARRGQVFQAPYPKQPKCPPEFWRREKRTKVKPNWEIIRLKEDRKQLQSDLTTLQQVIDKKSNELDDACVMVAGLTSTQRYYCETMGHPDHRTKEKLRQWSKKKRSLQKEYESLQHSRAAIVRLSSILHLECLAIRLKERT